MYSRPLAYHMYTDDPNALLTGLSRNNKIVRIEAKEILHGYLTESPNQLRGICPFVTAIKRLRRLGGYEDAELIASRVGASAMGIVESGSPEEAFRGIQEQEQIELEPGAFIRLQPGEHLNQFRADHPTTAFEAFVKAVLRGIAAGMNISYNSLTTDLESVSYSSIRAGTLSERDFFRIMQTFIINTFCRPLFEAWLPNNLDFGLLSDRLNDAEKRLILQQYEDPAIVKFYPRGWDWVDPLKDVNAAVVELNNGLASKTEILARKGKDIYQLQDELELERQVQNEPTANKVQKQSE
jgi:lambda family phage portal protein